MGLRDLILLLLLSWCFYLPLTHQLQSYQTQLLLQLRKHLEYPSQLQGWENYTGDFCSLPFSPSVKISCQGTNSVIELRIIGDKHTKMTKFRSSFNGFAIPNLTLSKSFSVDSLVTTLTRFPNLKVASLVSLGIWGPLPDKISRLHSLELLDLSANYLYSVIPPSLSAMSSLQGLVLDSNFLNGTLPDWLGLLSNLSVLSLRDNQLKGSFPSSLSHTSTLKDLSLSGNKLSGILPDLSNLHNLHLLDLRENHFGSELPKMPKSLVTALLSRNSFAGAIPKQFSELHKLQHLDLSYNQLSGAPPVTLFSLPILSYLNLASNTLSGSLPDELKCGNELGFIDISNNRFTGKLRSCLETSSGEGIVKYAGNCFSFGIKNQHEESYCHEHDGDKTIRWQKGRVLFISMVAGIVILVIVVVIFSLILVIRCKKQIKDEHHKLPKIVQDKHQSGLSADLLANARLVSQAVKAGSHGTPAYRTFTLEELEDATNGFHASTFLGQGTAGKVYKAKLKNGTDAVVRSMCLYGKHSAHRLKVRLDQLSKLRHPHLVALLGHCVDGCAQDQSSASRFFLVYEYMPNGSFRSHLSEISPMRVPSWSDRLAVLIDVAKAVHFLHTGVVPGSFRNRLSTNNILLDENGVAKLSDYGISVISEDVEKAEGKVALVDNDVYNFGFILLEALVGTNCAGKEESLLLNTMASFGSQDGRRKIVDPIVLRSCSQESLSIAISITNKCISEEVCNRPSFEDVLWNLQYAAQVQSSFEADQMSDDTLLPNPNPSLGNGQAYIDL